MIVCRLQIFNSSNGIGSYISSIRTMASLENKEDEFCNNYTIIYWLQQKQRTKQLQPQTDK